MLLKKKVYTMHTVTVYTLFSQVFLFNIFDLHMYLAISTMITRTSIAFEDKISRFVFTSYFIRIFILLFIRL